MAVGPGEGHLEAFDGEHPGFCTDGVRRQDAVLDHALGVGRESGLEGLGAAEMDQALEDTANDLGHSLASGHRGIAGHAGVDDASRLLLECHLGAADQEHQSRTHYRQVNPRISDVDRVAEFVRPR